MSLRDNRVEVIIGLGAQPALAVRLQGDVWNARQQSADAYRRITEFFSLPAEIA